MNGIIAWFKAQKISAHAIAGFGVSLAILISTDQAVRDFVLGLFHDHPKIGSEIVILAGLILKYSSSTAAPTPAMTASGSGPATILHLQPVQPSEPPSTPTKES